MQVTFLGTGSAMPNGERFQTGILVESGDQSVLIDCGSGVLHRLPRTSLGYEDVSTVLLTHHHVDHVADLLPLAKARWLAGDPHMEVVGPAGTEELLDGLLSVHDYLADKVEFEVREVEAGAFEVDGFDVRATETRHSMDCLAYRFDDRFGFSGDSEAFAGLADFFDGTAVLAHDCSFPDEIDVDNHPNPEQLGRALADTEIGRVYLTHRYPHTDGKEDEMLESMERFYGGDARMATDMLSVTIQS